MKTHNLTKFRAMYIHELQQMHLVDVQDPENTILTKEDIFHDGEIVFMDHIKIIPHIIEDDSIFKAIPLAIKI